MHVSPSLQISAVVTLLAGIANGSVLARQSSSGISNIVVFGDSYSDNCQLWRLFSPSNVSAAYPFPSCPSAPTGRFTGGYVWPEILQNGTGVNVHNYAVAGATCSNKVFNRTLGGVSIPAVDQQIESFVSYEQQGFDFSTAVAAVFVGTNDINFFTNALQYNPPNEDPGSATIDDEAHCVANLVSQLYSVGFTHIVMFKTIPLERVPYFYVDSVAGYGGHVSQNGTAVQSFVRQLAVANNALQAQYIPEVASTLPCANVTIFDTYSLFNNLLNNPTPVLGSAANVTGFCHVCPDTAMDTDCTECSNLENYAFWDPLHPSEAVDQAIAEMFAEYLGLSYENPL